MLTGQKLFKGEGLTETPAAVVMKEPELDRVPTEIRQALAACPEKDLRRRLREFAKSTRQMPLRHWRLVRKLAVMKERNLRQD